ncbi:MAG: NAD(P)H-hydrate dehydratase [Candidatus Pelagadaptatus aseana]|uniref:NAD(P)H-hydrate dehydratase n=1 Tax=Candidatus Pelagadaptatus aseana TaxID=3120508 RepID=UPI0039B1DD79
MSLSTFEFAAAEPRTGDSLASALPQDLYRAEQVRELDRCAIEDHGVAGIRLMKQAGRATFEALLQRWSDVEHITVLCGSGNNSGDGYIIAGLAAQKRIPVDVFYVADPEGLQGDARTAYQFACREGAIAQPFAEGQRLDGVLVDALLGTGLSGEVRGDYVSAINAINHSGLPVVAVDIPSGLCADTGARLGVAVKADLTVSFIGLKQGLLTGSGRGCCGQLLFDDLGVPEAVYEPQQPAAQRLNLAELLEHLPERNEDSHKGDFGHAMIIGGELGYAGAAAMAGEACARVGAGLTSVATRPEHIPALVARRPELMAIGVTSGQSLEPLLERPSVLVVGPGLGKTPWSEQLLQQAAQTGLPMVLDADALNLLAEGRLLAGVKRDNWVLTPHPGEAARLLGVSTAEIQADRFQAATALQQKFGGAVVLKGSGSLVVGEDGRIAVAAVGNPGMASGGMGDVLSGIIGGLLAQGLTPEVAARLGVCLHGVAADMAAEEEGQQGLLAADLMPYVRTLLNSVGES